MYRSTAVTIGKLMLGGDQPVRIQSMSTTDTNDIVASVQQCIGMISAGAELVRLTTQGKREVESLGKIRKALRSEGFNTPVVADVHFKAGLALEAALAADKIRINPGNYLKGKSPDSLLPELLRTCRENGGAIRIGVNHGSLDEAILNRYGNTPEGMVESAMPFLRICMQQDFKDVVVSMKSSNPRVMVHAVRLLADRMAREGMSYPLHLGVTEAGDGIAGSIRSVVGMAPLLLEGMGDTLRVSLTGPPEDELPVARMISDLFPKPVQHFSHPFRGLAWDPFSFSRRPSNRVENIGDGSKVKIISSLPPETAADPVPEMLDGKLVRFEEWEEAPQSLETGDGCLLLEQGNLSIQEVKARLNRFCTRNHTAPVVFKTCLVEKDPLQFQLKLAGEVGSLLIDGAIDAVWIENPFMTEALINNTLLMILQAGGARISQTEYIACPSCGRTHFDILARLREVRQATSHLTSLKIAVMGCIVNGPGEMADAHYGYVGAGPGRVSLYRGKDAVLRNIPEQEALKELIGLMKARGDWIDP